MPNTALKKAAPVRTKERRAWVRYHCELKVRCAEGKPGKPRRALASFNYQNLGKRWAAKVLNVSRGGMKLEVACCFEVGALFHVELDSVPDSKPLTIAARVNHIDPQQHGIWTIGCTFCKPLGRGELETLLLFGPGQKIKKSLLSRLGGFFRHGLSFLGLASPCQQ
jgi:PilZ domain-containing protein